MGDQLCHLQGSDEQHSHCRLILLVGRLVQYSMYKVSREKSANRCQREEWLERLGDPTGHTRARRGILMVVAPFVQAYPQPAAGVNFGPTSTDGWLT